MVFVLNHQTQVAMQATPDVMSQQGWMSSSQRCIISVHQNLSFTISFEEQTRSLQYQPLGLQCHMPWREDYLGFYGARTVTVNYDTKNKTLALEEKPDLVGYQHSESHLCSRISTHGELLTIQKFNST